MGFSSTWSSSHNDHTGVPVPSRHATRDEVLALCAVVKEFPGTTLEFIPQVGPFTDETFDLMADMSVAANRPLNWNLLQVQSQNWEMVQHQLKGGDIAAAKGGRVLALTLPDTFRLRLNLRSGFVLDILPGWDKLMALPPEEKLAMLRDPAGRKEMDELAQSAPGTLRTIANWGNFTLLETFTECWKPYEGQTIGAIATQLGNSAWDTLADIAIDDNLNTVIASMDTGQNDASWERRVEVWRDPRAVVGASDAGAHLDMIDSFSYATTLIARTTVDRSLLPLEEAVHYLTGSPAALYGLRDRGVVGTGKAADIVVFDPERIGPAEVFTKFDLPGGAGRVYGEANGISHVLVNGVPCVEGGELLDARPGTLIRSGRDTDTVTAH
jgi:N-acyl-D-aspartate/D-glutamate deacylase